MSDTLTLYIVYTSKYTEYTCPIGAFAVSCNTRVDGWVAGGLELLRLRPKPSEAVRSGELRQGWDTKSFESEAQVGGGISVY